MFELHYLDVDVAGLLGERDEAVLAVRFVANFSLKGRNGFVESGPTKSYTGRQI
jgi:hypothetical protein